MRPEDCGLIFYNGELRYFVDCDDLGDEVEALLIDGRLVMVRSYFSTKKQRVIKASEAIYRMPRPVQSISTNRQDGSALGQSDNWHHLPGSEEEL